MPPGPFGCGKQRAAPAQSQAARLRTRRAAGSAATARVPSGSGSRRSTTGWWRSVARCPRMRQAIDRDMRLPGLPREKVMACIMRILSTCFMRPGSEAYAKENGSFGIATWQNLPLARRLRATSARPRRTRSMGSHASADARVVLDAIRPIVRLLRQSARDAERRTGMSAAQLFVLQQLRVAGGALTPGELAERTLTHQSSVSVVAGRLVEGGLAKRQQSRADGRRVELSL